MARKTTTQIAAQLYTVRDFMKTPPDIAATFKKIKAIGYDAVQLSGLGPIPDQELKKIVDDNGLIVCATHVGFESLQKETEKQAAYHKLLQCRYPAIGGMPNEYRGSAEGILRFAAAANEVGQKLAAFGLTFGYHNHSFEFQKYGGKTGLEILYANTDPQYVKGEIDTYWVQHGGGDAAAWIRRLKGRIPYIHLKDMVMGADGKQLFAEVGEGNLNWEAILAAARAAGVEWYIIEQDTCQRDPFESLKISLENLKKMGLK